jgi:ferritin-like metal-binding protein YciE
MAAVRTLNDLFLHTLKDMYYSERRIMRTLPAMMKKAAHPELKQALERHRGETEGQIERLQKVFEMLQKPARGVSCEAMDGILAETESLMDEIEDPDVGDAGMIANAQAVAHYEITRYGTLVAWAEELGMREAAELLKRTLDEEKATDRKLTDLAEKRVNRDAAA